MGEKQDWKTPVIVIGAVVLAVIIVFLFINGTFSKKLSQEDIQISNFRYAREDSSIAEVPFSNLEEGKGIRTFFTATITTNEKKLFLKVYDVKNDLEIGPFILTNTGSNKISGYDLYLYSLGEKPELKFCISTKFEFNQYSKGVVCKTETFDNPEFKYEITPNPITFLINEQDKTNQFGGFRKEEVITIKNIGDINAPIYIKFPESSAPLLQPYYSVNGGSCINLKALRPGESCEYRIESASTMGIAVRTSEDQGFIYGIGNEFKKEFTLKTIINP